MSSKKTNKIFIILTTVFASLMMVFLCLFLSFLTTSKTYKNQLENSYTKAFYEMVDNVNTLEVDLSKIIATTSLKSQRELLDNIYNNCMLGVENINILPINNRKLTELNNLLNTAGGFSYSLLQNNFEGNLISEEDYNQISNIYKSVRELQYDLNNYLSGLKYDYSILDDVDFDDVESSNFSGGIVDNESSSSEVPTLIYDGPFSDSVINKEIKGLKENIVSIDEAKVLLQNVYPDVTIDYIGDTTGKFETYNFNINSQVKLYASVTKKGGLLLSITAFGSGKDKAISVSEGIDLAEQYAKDLGIENMYSVWNQQSGNILYVNLAPIVDRVIYYSDLIKVKVDLSLNLVVGWEATNYATNNISRSFTSTIGLIDASKKINSNLKIIERNLCIIPDKFVGELSAYEFICEWEDYTYFIYIDSNNGEEVNVLRVIETTNGQLLM